MKICFAEIIGINKMNDNDFTEKMLGFYNPKESDKIYFASSRSKDKIRNMLIQSSFLTKEIGTTRMGHLQNNSCFMFTTDHLEMEKQSEIIKLHKELQNSKIANKIVDEFYNDLMMTVRNLSILFSMAMWLVKDSSIQPKYIYLITAVNNYISVYDIKLDYTNSEGRKTEINISKDEVINCEKMMCLIYEHLLDIKRSENKKPTKVEIRDANYYEVNRNLSSINPSFTKTLMFIQEARNLSFLPSKIDKYIAAIQCIFAIKDNFTFNCSRVTASYISKNKKEHEDIIKYISSGYYIRSQISHGKQIDEKKYNLEKTSKKLDSYLRRIMKKVLLVGSLNYLTIDEEVKVRKIFKEQAISEFTDDYSNLKKDNRIVGIKKNIQGIADLDVLMDIQEEVKNRMIDIL